MRPRRLLAVRGIHYLARRFGPARLRSLAFDEKYRQGHWNFSGESSEELPRLIRNHLRGGDLLMLGCGGASLLSNLKPSDFSTVLGVDLSSEAIRLASRFASERVTFHVGNMLTVEYTQDYDVILFSESLNYVSAKARAELLQRLGLLLRPHGVFIVTFSQGQRYRGIIAAIQRSFHVIHDGNLSSDRRVLVFQPLAAWELVKTGTGRPT